MNFDLTLTFVSGASHTVCTGHMSGTSHTIGARHLSGASHTVGTAHSSAALVPVTCPVPCTQLALDTRPVPLVPDELMPDTRLVPLVLVKHPALCTQLVPETGPAPPHKQLCQVPIKRYPWRPPDFGYCDLETPAEPGGAQHPRGTASTQGNSIALIPSRRLYA